LSVLFEKETRARAQPARRQYPWPVCQ